MTTSKRPTATASQHPGPATTNQPTATAAALASYWPSPFSRVPIDTTGTPCLCPPGFYPLYNFSPVPSFTYWQPMHYTAIYPTSSGLYCSVEIDPPTGGMSYCLETDLEEVTLETLQQTQDELTAATRWAKQTSTRARTAASNLTTTYRTA